MAMTERERKRWSGLNAEAQAALRARDYTAGPFGQQVAVAGVDAGELAAADRRKPETKRLWIPGVETFSRTIHSQRHRGVFGEFVRRDEGILSKIGLWPKQWSAARMFAGTAKGFHVHPPSTADDTTPEKWHRRMFVVQGRVEMILRDVRAGLPTRTMRFFIDGDNHRSRNNVGVVIPPGVAHAIRVEGCEDAVMIYGTSTVFHPEFEGRIGSEIETAELPDSWRKFLGL